jgi:hypothetical protein
MTCVEIFQLFFVSMELTKKAIDILVEKEIAKRSVWVLGTKVFVSKEAALLWKENCFCSETPSVKEEYFRDAQPMRVLLDEPPGKRLYVLLSEHGVGKSFDDYDFWSPVCAIFTRKSKMQSSSVYPFMSRYCLLQEGGEWKWSEKQDKFENCL